MSKLINYLIILGTTLLLFYFSGLIPPTSGSFINGMIHYLLHPEQLQSWVVVAQMFALPALIAAGAVVIGLVAGFKLDLVVFAVLVPFFFAFLQDMIAIWIIVAQANAALACILLAPLMFVYVISVIEWWRAVV